MAASVFLDEVQVRPSPRGGYVVEAVLPQSRYDRMGLRAGDVVYSLDTPAMAAVDEGSMVALMLQTEIELDVYRQGQPMRLRVALNTDP
jgi:S1-C subfamily serine protease